MEKTSDLLCRLRSDLTQELENTWDISDEEIMEMIDNLLLEEKKKTYLSLTRLEDLKKELFQSLRKMDVLEELLEDESITEIMVNHWDRIFIEREGRLSRWEKSFTSPEKL